MIRQEEQNDVLGDFTKRLDHQQRRFDFVKTELGEKHQIGKANDGRSQHHSQRF
jgi:hypothetical protein